METSPLTENLLWIAGALVVLIAAWFYMRKILADRAERDAINHDPYSHVVNDTNYNIAREGMDGHRDEGLNQAEANEAVEDFKESVEMPTREEFHEIRKDLKK